MQTATIPELLITIAAFSLLVAAIATFAVAIRRLLEPRKHELRYLRQQFENLEKIVVTNAEKLDVLIDKESRKT
jgi:hypothetical protein